MTVEERIAKFKWHYVIQRAHLSGLWLTHFPDFEPEEVFSPICLRSYPWKLDFSHWKSVQMFRRHIGVPLVVNDYLWNPEPLYRHSGTRTTYENKLAGGKGESLHKEGKATDLKCAELSTVQLFESAYLFGFTGIGLYDSFIHVDSRWNPYEPVVWDDRSELNQDRVIIDGRIIFP